MSADVLRQAAALMRERAEVAICPCGGPACTIARGGVRAKEMAARFDGWTRVMDHYVGMSSAVALAVADWLDAEAEAIDRHLSRQADPERRFASLWTAAASQRHAHALAVADAYLGRDA